MSNERDELAELISCHDSYGYFEDERGSGSECSCGTEICPGLEYAPAAHVGHLTDVILAAGYRTPRTATTAEELDALPVGSVVLDKYDGAWTKASNGSATWWFTGDGLDFESKSSLGVASLFGPATVLHEPEPVSEP